MTEIAVNPLLAPEFPVRIGTIYPDNRDEARIQAGDVQANNAPHD